MQYIYIHARTQAYTRAGVHTCMHACIQEYLHGTKVVRFSFVQQCTYVLQKDTKVPVSVVQKDMLLPTALTGNREVECLALTKRCTYDLLSLHVIFYLLVHLG